MYMAFLEAQITEPKNRFDYKQASFEFDARNVHPIDQMEMHKQTSEMISSSLTKTSMSLFKMQVALSNAQSQLNMENISYQWKENIIKSLEDLVVKNGYDPSDVKALEEIIKKEGDIESLSK